MLKKFITRVSIPLSLSLILSSCSLAPFKEKKFIGKELCVKSTIHFNVKVFSYANLSIRDNNRFNEFLINLNKELEAIKKNKTKTDSLSFMLSFRNLYNLRIEDLTPVLVVRFKAGINLIFYTGEDYFFNGAKEEYLTEFARIILCIEEYLKNNKSNPKYSMYFTDEFSEKAYSLEKTRKSL